jgi:pyridinium-3,5-bisthiocarboxylic acid mononucleotide nickel chelatase
MKTLYLDCFAGISGDMFIGALLDLGLDPAALAAELNKLPIAGFHLEFERVKKLGIQAVQFKVMLDTPYGVQLADSDFIEIDPLHAGSPPASIEHDSPPPPDLETSDPASAALHAAHGAHHDHRKLPDIIALIQRSPLSANVRTLACRIFERLAEAEVRVHGLPASEVHFHEVGGDDAILDITGAALCLELLGIEAVYASTLHLGSGFVHSQHGLMPVPAPATAELIRGVPAYSSQVKGELVTPTGAAILTSIAQGYGPMPLMNVQSVGYGAGSRDRDFPNVLRAILGTTDPSQSIQPASAQSPAASPAAASGSYENVASVLPIAAGESIPAPREPHPEQHQSASSPAGYHESPAIVIEANIDDMNPQFYQYLLDRLLAAGALDAVLIPIYMKKNRPGLLLQVLAHPTSLDDLLAIIYTESTSIGIRTYEVTKRMLQREIQLVQTPYGSVRIKISRLGEHIVNLAPEYEDCRALAASQDVPLKQIHAAALSAAQALLQEG